MQTPTEVLRIQLKAVGSSYQDYLNNPFEVEHVHQLRVNLRCLRALLRFLKPTIDKSTYTHLSDQLRQAGLILSPLRDLDILLAFCGVFATENPTLSSNYQKLFNYLGILRRREMRKSLNKTHRQLFEKTLELADIQLTDSLLTTHKNWPKYIQKRLSKKMRQLEKLMTQVNEMDYEAIHETRKKAKKLRYAATYFADATEQNLTKVSKYAKAIQSDLGKQTDAHVMSNLLAELADNISDKISKTAVDNYSDKSSGKTTEIAVHRLLLQIQDNLPVFR